MFQTKWIKRNVIYASPNDYLAHPSLQSVSIPVHLLQFILTFKVNWFFFVQIVKRGFAPSLFLTIQKIRLAAICGEAAYNCGLWAGDLFLKKPFASILRRIICALPKNHHIHTSSGTSFAANSVRTQVKKIPAKGRKCQKSKVLFCLSLRLK